MGRETGFTLIEILIVLAVAGILMSLATLQFSHMTRKAGIEKTARQMLADVENARVRSIFSKTPTRVYFEPASYSFRRYSSANEDRDAGTLLSSQSLPYTITAEDGSSLSGTFAEFDPRGATGSKRVIMIEPSGVASVDCLLIDIVKTSIGRIEGGKCVPK